ncbi:MAG TPA: SAM-dependent DNA methyltransferase, partial [Sedimenticola sp.]|nr:SAM-dependent DNA methyltransferase [Sedimenticola sp.]
AQPALGGLFAADQCPHLEQAALANHHLYQALFHLGWFESGRTLVRINYRDMDTEELGSVYESLLELVPELRTEGRWSFGFLGDEPGYTGDGAGQGNARKLSGSYYTPDSLVQELVRTALEPVIRQRLAARPEEPRATLLGITVCDPACGSGHFLLAAARRLAAELARIQAGADQPTEADYRHALREVVRHCIYGVDINPLAVELCKTALWLETLEPGRPLGFLDAHIQCGNALVGLFDPGLLRQGIPAAAYRPLTGDDRKSCAALKKRNRIDRRQRQLLTGHQAPPAVCAGDLLAMPEEELDQIERKRAAWAALVQGPACRDERQRADLFTAAFFAPKTPQTAERVPTSVELAALEAGDPLPGGMAEQVSALARQHRFFHWYLAFPEVLERGGFAVMLGNPPWERIKLQEKEFFASRSPAIASAPNAAARNRKIQALRQGSPVEQALYAAFMVARQGAEAASIFVRGSGRFPLTGTGDVNLYALFAEHFAHGIGAEGRAGMIVPTGIATDDSTKAFFGAITGGNRLVSLFDFENREAIFPGVHRSYKFSLLTLGRPGGAAELAFFATRPEQLRDPERRFSLTPAEFALINPNPRTCPVFRARRDADLTKKLYRAAPVLIREATRDGPEPNPWGIRFSRLFDMSNDSGLFRSHEQLDGETSGLLPLYEAKMVHQYDHRWATYETDGRTSRNCTLAEKRDPAFEPRPRYWVEAWQVTLRTARAPAGLLKAARSGDGDALITVLAEWAAGHALAQGDPATARRLLGRLPGMAEMPPLRDAGGPTPHAAALQRQAEAWPLTREEARALDRSLTDGDDPWPVARRLLEARRPGYLLGWRDICRSTDERTVIAGVIPLAAVGDTFLLMFPEVTDQRLVACLLADQCSLVHDFVARQKIGGTHLKYHMKKQITTLAPDQYTEDDLDYIVPRVLELSYTSHALAPFARDLGYHGDPFPYDPERRHRLKCE